MSDQLATQAVDALAKVRSIDVYADNHPMRHNVRRLKHEAEAVLENAFRHASNLAFLAEQVVGDYDKSASVKKEGGAA